jgi:hypothetical protein
MRAEKSSTPSRTQESDQSIPSAALPNQAHQRLQQHKNPVTLQLPAKLNVSLPVVLTSLKNLPHTLRH